MLKDEPVVSALASAFSNFRRMEIRDIFKLRKEGRTEEAYAAILPMYAVHKGHYTTIAMFWVGVDMMKLRYQQRQLEEAYKIFRSLLRLYPTMDDKDLKGQSLNACSLISLRPSSGILHA